MTSNLKYMLIGMFSHGCPNIQNIQSKFSIFGLKEAFTLGVINIKHVLICLSSEEDFTRFWLKLIWFIDGISMRIFKWTPEFNTKLNHLLFRSGLASRNFRFICSISKTCWVLLLCWDVLLKLMNP